MKVLEVIQTKINTSMSKSQNILKLNPNSNWAYHSPIYPKQPLDKCEWTKYYLDQKTKSI